MTQLSDSVTHRVNEVLDESYRAPDRSAVILATAEIDQTLRELLEAYFIAPSKTSKKYGFSLFGPDEPGGSFSSRIELCYRSGLISEWCQREAHILRKIRNEFAHKTLGYTFNSSPARELIQALDAPAQLKAKAKKGDYARGYWGKPRNLFAISAGMVLTEIVCAKLNVLDGETLVPVPRTNTPRFY
jgi:DNA-binding MltR family transcriptional regulator